MATTYEARSGEKIIAVDLDGETVQVPNLALQHITKCGALARANLEEALILSSRSGAMTEEVLYVSKTTDYRDQIQKLYAFIEAHFSGSDASWVRLLMEEVISDAVKHGNKYDPEKVLRFSYGIQDGEFIFFISDQGEGFDVSALPNCNDPRMMLRPSGRGVLLADTALHRFDGSGLAFPASPEKPGHCNTFFYRIPVPKKVA